MFVLKYVMNYKQSPLSQYFSQSLTGEKSPPTKNITALITEEKAETGRVKFSVLLAYLKACTWVMSGLTILLYILTTSASVGSNFWLAEWSNAEGALENATKYNGTFDSVTICDHSNYTDV